MSTTPQTYGMPGTADGPGRAGALVVSAIALVAIYLLLARPFLLKRVTASNNFTAPLIGSNATSIFERQGNPDIDYRVDLESIPPGGWLELQCDWLDPAGSVARRNHYSTRFVYKFHWRTHCHQRFGPEAAAGAWQVRMLMGERVLSTAAFVLK